MQPWKKFKVDFFFFVLFYFFVIVFLSFGNVAPLSILFCIRVVFSSLIARTLSFAYVRIYFNCDAELLEYNCSSRLDF